MDDKNNQPMTEIICPECGARFSVSTSSYNELAHAVRNAEFEKDVSKQCEAMKNEAQAKHNEELMKAQMEAKEKEQKQQTKIAELMAQMDAMKNQHESELKVIRSQVESETQIQHQKEISVLNQQLNDQKMAAMTAQQASETKIAKLQSDIDLERKQAQIDKDAIQKDCERAVKAAEDEVERYKNFKLQMSTKMIGESLERYCENEFNKIRSMAYPNAYFEKDNDARTGSKGDFIFRDYDGDIEYISIMFEMKNEADQTASKHKNEDFFKELDKDRKEKKCEYAVLVTMLESDNELYNTGIVDVSHKYPKMYVVRPQFFLQIISLLRNAAKDTIEYRKELQIIQNREVDVTHFEESLLDFQGKFGRNCELAARRFNEAVEEVDKVIARMQKLREYLVSSNHNLELAHKKADALTIRSLTKNNPTMKAKFLEAKNQSESDEDFEIIDENNDDIFNDQNENDEN